MRKIFSIVLLLFLLVGFGTVFVNLCAPLVNSCHEVNPFEDCHYKPTSSTNIAKIEIVPSFNFICLLNPSIDKPTLINKPSAIAFIEQQFLEYSSLVKLLNPSNAPPRV